MKKASVALLIAFLATRVGAAETMRCGGEVVSTGDLKFEVLSKCGEPAAKESRERAREVGVFDAERNQWKTVRTTVTVEQWTYNFGPGGFLYVVTFEDGRVVSIKSAGFGR